jgi:SPP1 family predicted phage head-tail adaptor
MGEVAWTWEEVTRMWAEIGPVSGREAITVQQVQSEINTTIWIRWRPGVTAKMRVVEVSNPSVQYDIEVPLANARRTGIKLMCVTRDAEGWRG